MPQQFPLLLWRWLISSIEHKLVFFCPSFLAFKFFWFILNMMPHYSWETGFKIKGDKQIFGCLDWLCEQCWLAVGYPDQLSSNKLIQLFILHTLWRRDTWEPHRRWAAGRDLYSQDQTTWRDGWKAVKFRNHSRRWVLKTRLSTLLRRGRAAITTFYYTFCNGWDLIPNEGSFWNVLDIFIFSWL